MMLPIYYITNRDFVRRCTNNIIDDHNLKMYLMQVLLKIQTIYISTINLIYLIAIGISIYTFYLNNILITTISLYQVSK
jgi:hypothetical protein